MIKLHATLCLTLSLSIIGVSSGRCAETPRPVRISVDVNDIRSEITPTLYGTGMEDVNHEIYGGLDAQRLFGESFEEPCPTGCDTHQSHGVSLQWDKAEALDGGDFVWDRKVAHQGQACQSLIPHGGVASIANAGLRRWGVPCRAGRSMRGYLWVRGKTDRLEVALQDAWGEKTYATAELATVADEVWRKVAFTLSPCATDAHGRFLIRASGKGTVWIDDVYLADEPTNALGRMGCREDIVAGLQDMGLTFVRWGGTMSNARQYRLANMPGDGTRKPYAGYWYQQASGGFGPYEFVRFANALRLPCAVSISAYEKTDDAVRFARAMQTLDTPVYVQIGNEELTGWGQNPEDARNYTGVTNYCSSTRRLVTAMRQANPKLTFIHSGMWLDATRDVNLLEEEFHLLDGLVEYWDVHVGFTDPASARKSRNIPRRVMELFKKWNPKSTMKVAILEENGNNHGLDRALAHAVMLETAREMGRDLLTSCPANALQPYLHNDNWWDQGNVFFTPTRVWLSPCGQAQKMAASHHRDWLVAGTSDDSEVSVSATRDRAGRSVVLHLVNSAHAAKPLRLDCVSGAHLKVVRVQTLAGSSVKADNSPEEPLRVSPRDVTAAFRERPELSPYSYTVITLE